MTIDKSVFVRVWDLAIGGRTNDEQLAFRFSRHLELTPRAGSPVVLLEAPSVMHSARPVEGTWHSTDAIHVHMEGWLARCRAFDEAFGARFVAGVATFAGDDLRAALDVLTSEPESARITVADRVEPLCDRMRGLALGPDADSPLVDQFCVAFGDEPPGFRGGVLHLGSAGSDDAVRLVVYQLLGDVIVARLVRSVREQLSGQLDALKRAAVQQHGGAGTGEFPRHGSVLDEVIRAGHFRNAWALLLTQRQTVNDAAWDGAPRLTCVQHADELLRLSSKLDSAAAILSAVEELIASGHRPTPSEFSTAATGAQPALVDDTLSSLLTTWASEGVGMREIKGHLHHISARLDEGMALGKVVVGTVVIAAALVVIAVVGALLFPG